MAQPKQKSRDLLADLGRHTERLEAEVAQLTKNYDHWRLWEAEYEALGDDVHQARTRFPNAEKEQKAELVRIRRDFDGQLVDHATVCELFGARLGQTITRSIDSIATAIGRRLDYVQQNTATLKRQVEEAGNKLAAARVVSRPSMPAPGAGVGGLDDDDDAAEDSGFEGATDDNYGPVTDIMEELDEDGNVVSFQLHTPSSTQTQVLDALKKAGVDEIPAGGPLQANTAETETAEAGASSSKAEAPASAETATETAKPAASSETPPTRKASLKPTPRRSVSFADETKGAGADAEDASSAPHETFAAQRLGKIIQSAKDQESLVDADAVLPENEDDDEAALRREMLEYSMSEIGPIVAQLDIEEGVSDDEGFNDEDYDDDYDDEDDDDEDQFGRSKYSVIDEAYRERMLELEKKLGVKPMAGQSIVPTPTVLSRDDIAESLGRIRVSAVDAASAAVMAPGTSGQRAKAAPTSALKEPTASFRAKAKATGGDGKKVSFATDLDIAPEKEEVKDVAAPAEKTAPAEPFVDPLSDVIERRSAPTVPSVTAPGAEPKPTRVSRFRAARGDGPAAPAAATPTVPTLPKGPHQAPVRFLDEDRIVAPSGPEGKTHSEDVFERQAVTEAKEPHELDAHLVFQETATEYHRTRNRLVQQEGGFMKASETAVVPVGQEDGGPRISKFKAARIGQQFMNP